MDAFLRQKQLHLQPHHKPRFRYVFLSPPLTEVSFDSRYRVHRQQVPQGNCTPDVQHARRTKKAGHCPTFMISVLLFFLLLLFLSFYRESQFRWNTCQRLNMIETHIPITIFARHTDIKIIKTSPDVVFCIFSNFL